MRARRQASASFMPLVRQFAFMICVVGTSGVIAPAQSTAVIDDFESTDDFAAWRQKEAVIDRVERRDAASSGHALRMTRKPDTKKRSWIYRRIVTNDWRWFESLTFRVAVESKEKIEIRFRALRGNGPAAMVHRLDLEPGGWRPVTIPLRDFRFDVQASFGDFARIDMLAIQWRDGAGSVTIDDIALRYGNRGIASAFPTARQRLDVLLPRGRSFEREGFQLLTDVASARDDTVAPTFEDLAKVRRILANVFGIDHPVAEAVPVCVTSSRTVQRAIFERYERRYRVSITPPKSTGYTAMGVATALWDRKTKWRRPVIVHEAAHAYLERALRLPPTAQWIHEGLASAVQVRVHPGAFSRRKMVDDFKKRKVRGKGRFVSWSELVTKRIGSRDYPQAMSIMDFFADRYRGSLVKFWGVVRAAERTDGRRLLDGLVECVGQGADELEKEWLDWGPTYYSD